MPDSALDLTNVDSDSAYHNWLEASNIPHTAEREQAFREGWRILSDFIAGDDLCPSAKFHEPQFRRQGIQRDQKNMGSKGW